MVAGIGRRRLVGVPLTSFGAALAALVLTAGSVLGSVSWTSPVAAGPGYTWNFGHGLARTVSGTTAYLHVQYGTDFVGGAFVDDDGPAHAGVYYRRGNSSGSSWGTPRRMNPTDQHAYQGAIAAAGSRVYVAWSSVAHVGTAYDAADPRLLWFRANDSHGAAASWRDETSLTSSGRIDHPTMAATGAYVYIAHTDADTGSILLHVSDDYGVSWDTVTVGTTDRVNGENGFAGWPVVAATGSTVAVAWENNDEPTFAVSADNGGSFTPQESIGVQPTFEISIAARGDRIAVAWMSEAGAFVRVRTGEAWGPMRGFAGFDSSLTYKRGYGPAVVLAGTSKLGIAWSACRRSSCAATSDYGVDIRWRESNDNGAHWVNKGVTVASYAASSSRRINDYPSVLMTSTKRRVIVYNAAAKDYSKYRLYVEVGTGAP